MGKAALQAQPQPPSCLPTRKKICIFILFSISIHDLADFVANVEPTPLPQDIAKYPIPREHHLNFLKPGIKLVLINMSSFNMQIFTYFMVHVVLFQFQI